MTKPFNGKADQPEHANALTGNSLEAFERCLDGWNRLAGARGAHTDSTDSDNGVMPGLDGQSNGMRIGAAYFEQRADILRRLERAKSDVVRLQAELDSHLNQERSVIAAELRRVAQQFELGIDDILGDIARPLIAAAPLQGLEEGDEPLGMAKRAYRSTDGQVWQGRGRYPRWLKQALAQGHSLAEFEIQLEGVLP